MGAPRFTDRELVLRHVAVMPDGCWLWLGGRDKDGYGKMTVPAEPGDWRQVRYVRAHRRAYELWRGAIPEGLELDHFFCEQPACVNPEHVRPVTTRENVYRSNGVAAANLAKRQCLRGHEFDYEWNGTRQCRECQRIAYRERQALL
jgi:HNH endonuclease